MKQIAVFHRPHDLLRIITIFTVVCIHTVTAGFILGPAGSARHRKYSSSIGIGDYEYSMAAASATAIHDEVILRRRNMLAIAGTLLLGAPAALADDHSTTLEEPPECRNGGIISESAVPGAYQQACMDLNERSFSLKTSGDAITLYQGTNSAGGTMAGRTGVAVWNSGILLTRLLDALCRSHPSALRDKTVVELGCGTALASIAAAKLGASAVLATDFNPEVLALAARNIARNGVSPVAVARPLPWGLLDAYEYEGRADVIIGSDLTYNSGSWLALAETMATVLKPHGVVVYLSLGHAGFNVGGEMGGFLSVIGNVGLQLLTKDSTEWKDSIGSQSTDDLIARIISPQERTAIDANGGVRVVFLGKKVRRG